MASKYAVSKVVGKLKGGSAIILFDRHPEWRGKAGRDRTLWARGYYVSTVGMSETVMRSDIEKREEGGRIEWRKRPHWGPDGDGSPPTVARPQL